MADECSAGFLFHREIAIAARDPMAGKTAEALPAFAIAKAAPFLGDEPREVIVRHGRAQGLGIGSTKRPQDQPGRFDSRCAIDGWGSAVLLGHRGPLLVSASLAGDLRGDKA